MHADPGAQCSAGGSVDDDGGVGHARAGRGSVVSSGPVQLACSCDGLRIGRVVRCSMRLPSLLGGEGDDAVDVDAGQVDQVWVKFAGVGDLFALDEW